MRIDDSTTAAYSRSWERRCHLSRGARCIDHWIKQRQTLKFTFLRSFHGACLLVLIACCTPLAAQQFEAKEFQDSTIQTLDPHVAIQNDYPTIVELVGNDETQKAPQSECPPRIDGVDAVEDGLDWLSHVRVGYDADNGFVIASEKPAELGIGDAPFIFNFNGWGQLRHTYFNSQGANTAGIDEGANQFQLKRGRLVFSGSAFTSDFAYFVQLDGRSSDGDDLRLLDYFLSFDIGHHSWGLEPGRIGFRTGKYKMPFHMSRWLSGRDLQFADRSMASTYFDVNRSLAWGLYGETPRFGGPLNWEVAIFNGLVTGGAETGSSGDLDDNFAYSGRVFWRPVGEWGDPQLSDLTWHRCLAMQIGAGIANSTINRAGATEFNTVRVVDSGSLLSSRLPRTVGEYTVNLYAIDISTKYRGWSFTLEYYFRQIDGFQGAAIPDLLDHGHWLQIGKFVVPGKLELLTRWSRVSGDSQTLGMVDLSADTVAGGFAYYFRGQRAKLVSDFTYLNGTPVNSAALDMSPGDIGWLYRTQIQFAF